MNKIKTRQRVKSEMNVVPYIDVMLVLLVIFMISAPLINQSVEISLPNSNNSQEADSNDSEKFPLIISVDRAGSYFIEELNGNVPISKSQVNLFAQKTFEEDPNQEVYIRGDKNVDYGTIMKAMDILKQTGFEAVGLITSEDEQ